MNKDGEVLGVNLARNIIDHVPFNAQPKLLESLFEMALVNTHKHEELIHINEPELIVDLLRLSQELLNQSFREDRLVLDFCKR